MKATISHILIILVYALFLPLVGFGQRAGDLDSSFNYGRGVNYRFNYGYGADNEVQTVSSQIDGKIIIGGNFTTFNGSNRNRIARLNPDGSLDNSFNPGTGPFGTTVKIY